MKAKPHYQSNPRNGYGAVDYLEGNKVVATVCAGVQPQKLADEMEGKLNEAVDRGWEWARLVIRNCSLGKKDTDILSCIYNEFKV